MLNQYGDRVMLPTHGGYANFANWMLLFFIPHGWFILVPGCNQPAIMKNRGGVKKMLLTVVIMCLVWACALGQLSDIRGTVRDADTGVVLQDANVRVMHLPISHLTNANGKFELPRVPMGELELWVKWVLPL